PLDLPGAPTHGAEGASKQDAHGLDVGALVEVGPYAITPVKARGAAAVGELNRYLEAHGFGTEDPAHLAWFAENEFTFLCIQITPPAGAARLGEHLDLVPLHVRFAAEQPYYPGKYSAQQGNFALALTLLTTEPVQRESLRAVRQRLEAWHPGHDNLFTVQPLAAPFTPATAHARADRWYVNRCDTRGFNRILESGEPAIHAWADDVTWTLGGEADLPPDWYYGDGERPVWHATDTRTLAQYANYAAILAVLIAILWTGFHVLRRVVRMLAGRGSSA
ncbi:MAG: DUF2330 domain-containing protein, partial [Planctomycetota bacterium]|nr:DUF2330 domain-containing protein [Planctomycetota bacterium]